MEWQDSGQIGSVSVRRPWRRQGVATALLQHAFRAYYRRGIYRVVAECDQDSFTGAHKDRQGYAEAADGGTLFLDEIGEMPMEMQAKLLRFLQEGEVRPVGGNSVKHVDVRVVAATNRALEKQIKAGAFREDLYYRLAVLTLSLPALRERPEDIEPLAKFLLHRNKAEGLPTAKLSQEAVEALRSSPWPGNIRQLQNELTRAAAFARAGLIEAADLELVSAP